MNSPNIKEGLNYLSSLKGWVGQKDFSLSRIQAVASYFGDPQTGFKSIHVAGTNGKGSTASALSSIFLASGCRVGLYTSPHLLSINERIKVNGQDISDECLILYLNKIKEALSALRIELSQFEVLTLISFLVFRDEKVDYGVIEVGLGGRLDATNIIPKPDIVLITSISLDHQEILGSSIPEIAKEKAGVIKKGVTLILGEIVQEAKLVIIENASEAGQVFEFNKDFYGKSLSTNLLERQQLIEYRDGKNEIEIETCMLGNHQVSNLSVAVKAALELGVSAINIKEGLRRSLWKGRLELQNIAGKSILMDAAHNEAGIISSLNFCKENQFKPDIVIFSALKTKNWKQMLANIDIKIKQWFIIESDSVMALPCDEIESFISMHELGNARSFYKDYEQLVNEIINLPQNTNILALGSIYMLAALKPQLERLQ